FQVTEQLNIPVRKLSFGQRMKLEIIAALLHSPKVLFLDEPTIGLDLIAQKSIRKFLKIYNQQYKATIILTSHNLDDIKQLCERVILINHGQIVYDGNLNKLGQESEILQYKLIEMTMGDQIDPERFNKYGNIVEANGFKVKLMVKAENISLIIPQLFNEFRIQDISVKENEIEDVIEKIMLKSM
ncbi:MAG: AAA family ATPase, partial [Halanaerobiales bacterium]|nr:AAA family ATPase [Halanaerobiales bacterium]